MTIEELADQYDATAARIREAIKKLEAAEQNENGRRKAATEHDLRIMRQMLREAREIGEVLRHYYDKGHYSNKKYTF